VSPAEKHLIFEKKVRELMAITGYINGI